MKIHFIVWIFITAVILISFWYTNDIYYKFIDVRQPFSSSNEFNRNKSSKLKYILVWSPAKPPMKTLAQIGNKTFTTRNCTIIDCYVSSNRGFFRDITKFDVIVFHGPDVSLIDLPKTRSPRQKYVYANKESADNVPVCDKKFNNFFNWTWTYKLNSDISYKYISIWNKEGIEIGPQTVMQWRSIEDMDPIDMGLQKKLRMKKFAAAWFVSHCDTHSKREIVAMQLKLELKKRGFELHVYGKCGTYECPKLNMLECLKLLETDYYFYLSFENSFNEDYVTEKLLNPLQHYTIPIVFGGANYTRFMPDGIYLNARQMSITDLADKMADIISDKKKYYSYFKWHNHYSYHNPIINKPEYDSYCKMCSFLHDEKQFNQISTYNNFIGWWNEHQC